MSALHDDFDPARRSFAEDISTHLNIAGRLDAAEADRITDLVMSVVEAYESKPWLDPLPNQERISRWLTGTFGPDGILSVSRALKLAEEVGEICGAIVKRKDGHRSGLSHEEWTVELRKEIGDAQISLLALAEAEQMDLVELTRERWAEVTTR